MVVEEADSVKAAKAAAERVVEALVGSFVDTCRRESRRVDAADSRVASSV